MLGRVLALLVVALGILTVALHQGAIRIPDNLNPWATLDVTARPNFLTRHKLERLSLDPQQCLEVLTTTGYEYTPIDDQRTGTNCGFHNVVQIARTSAAVGSPFALSCRSAISLALWERHVLQPLAIQNYGVEVAKIEHFGSYSCRNVYGRPNATRSRHATAEALDVAGFVLANGERIRVVNDWSGAHALFLSQVRDGACRFFDGVLSPDYNAAHRDHFHFDRGPYRTCR
jgi:hypothetical protein